MRGLKGVSGERGIGDFKKSFLRKIERGFGCP